MSSADVKLNIYEYKMPTTVTQAKKLYISQDYKQVTPFKYPVPYSRTKTSVFLKLHPGTTKNKIRPRSLCVILFTVGCVYTDILHSYVFLFYILYNVCFIWHLALLLTILTTHLYYVILTWLSAFCCTTPSFGSKILINFFFVSHLNISTWDPR